MALNSNPIVQVTFNSLDQMSCTLFLQDKIPGSGFKKINNTFDNVNGNVFSFIIDPTKPPINGSSLSDLSDCQLGWTVKCFDLDRNGRIIFSFEINVEDSGSNIMTSSITEISPDVTTSASGNTAVFEGAFVFP